MTRPVRFVLASASPARLKTLHNAGIDPVVIVSGVDEERVSADSPAELAGLLATLKARAVVAGLDDHATVLGCDSVLELDGTAYGKPGTPEVARDRLKTMRGRSGVLHTGHCLFDTWSRQEVREVASTTVHFADFGDDEIEAYVATGEPLAVAGSFTVDGLGGAFVAGIEGDHHNVVGLSLPLLRLMLGSIGIDWPSLWRRPEPAEPAELAEEDAVRAAAALHELLPGRGTVLDVAVGNGMVAAELAVLGHLVHGADTSGGRLREARIRLPGHVVRTDGLAVADGSVQAVTAILPGRPVDLAETARVLGRDGVLLTTLDADGLEALATRAARHGLELTGATSFGSGAVLHVVARFTKR